MDENTKDLIRRRYQAEIDHAEKMIEFIDKYRFVIRSQDDHRTDEELMDEQKQMHYRLIDNYTRYLNSLDG